MNRPVRLAVLLSGGGTTLQNLLDQVTGGRLSAAVVAVISNHADAYGLTRAEQAGIATHIVERKESSSLEEFSRRIFEKCRAAGVDLICMGGFMQLLSIPGDFTNRVMNIHPSLIPAFCGKGFYGEHVHEAVLAAGVKVTGCTVHFADNEYDHGPIIVQKTVDVREDDTVDKLMARVFEKECIAYPEAIRLFAEGRLRVEGRRVRVFAGK